MSVGSQPAPQIRAQSLMVSPTTSNSDCSYTLEQVQGWLTQVQCFVNNGYYVGTSITQRQLNIYIGTLKSAINYPTNICYFQTQLADVSNFIIYLQTIRQCQS